MNIAGRNLLAGMGYLVAYVALDALSFVQPLLKLGITPWNPQAGLTVAFLVFRGWRQVPWTAAAVLLAELIVRGAPAPPFYLICVSVIIAACYGALAFALSRYSFDPSLASRRAILQLIFGSALTALLVASGYATAFMQAGVLPPALAGDAIARYWVGDLNGIFTLTPLVLAAQRAARAWPELRAHRGLIACQAIVLAALLWLVLGARPLGEFPLVYVLFAPVIWTTLTWGVLGATVSTLLIQIALMAVGASRLGPSSLLEIHYFLVTIALTALLLAAVLAERTRALARVAASEAEQRALLAAAPDAVLSTNLAGEVTSANPAAEQLFRAPASIILGTSLTRWLPDLFQVHPVERCRLRGARANGERFPAEIACVLLNSPARPGYLVIAHDMTEHERAQAQLRERDATLANSMRFALVGELSTALTHELNQPITALVSYLKAAEMLAAPIQRTDPRLEETLRKATREALRASDVLKRLRDFYRAGTAHVTVIDVETLIAEVMSTFTDRAGRLGIDLTQEMRVAREMSTDRVQLQMVLHNLLANALDAVADAAPDRRRVHVTATADEDRLCLTVEDSGCGVPADIIDQLFEPFVTSKTDGMGLGLAISRSLLRSQGGELRLDTSSASGTRFVLELPITLRTKVAA
jgi:two-component system, LuxR family, sensor kinase FixL